MKQSEWDVIIVGAGPTGGRTATHLASLGHSVLMLEEHSEIGQIYVEKDKGRSVHENTFFGYLFDILFFSFSQCQTP